MPGDKKKGRCEETPSLKKDSRLGGVPVVLGGCTQEGCTARASVLAQEAGSVPSCVFLFSGHFS